MARKSPLTYDSFIRDLPFTLRMWLSQRLNPFDSWEGLAAAIPVNHEDLLSQYPPPFEPRYETLNMFTFKENKNPTMCLLKDWEMENCQIKHLIQALRNASLLEAADHIACQCTQPTPLPAPESPQQLEASGHHHQQRSLSQISAEDTELREDILTVNGGGVKEACLEAAPPQRTDPPVEVDCLRGKEEEVSNDKTAPATEQSKSRSSQEDVKPMPEFSFQLLQRITRNFDPRDKTQGGSRIGTGGFGDVYFGEFLGNKLAVKRLKENDETSFKQFETELKTLCAYKHENLVTLMGYCSDGMSLCLVYEYVVNGSLEDRLACLHGSAPLSTSHRLEIARGTARGIHYLHGKGVTHRDIKTANILLDENYKPKVSDFATARSSPKSVSQTIPTDNKTQVLIGTPYYLDPEAYDHIIHPGLDVYSFGVVLLELITGLPVYDPSRDDEDLKVYVREYCTPFCPTFLVDGDDDDKEAAKDGTIFDLLDMRPGVEWDSGLVEELYALSKGCLERRDERKTIKQVLQSLNNMADLYFGDGGDLPEK